jgi:hypothetical protein
LSAVLLLAGLATTSAKAGPVAAKSEGLQTVLGEFARKVALALRNERKSAVVLGDFTGPARGGTSAGPGIQKLLIDALQREGVNVRRDADATLKGEYVDVRDGGGVVLRLRAVLRDGKDAKLAEMQKDVSAEEDIVKALSLTGAIKKESASRNKQILRLLDRPTVYVTGTRIQARRGSPYAIEVLARKDLKGKPQARKPWVENKQAFVNIERGELYEVRIRNSSKNDVGVSLTIDGIDVFAFSEARKANGEPYKYFVVKAGKRLSVTGWFKTPTEADAFEITSFAKSAVAKLMADTAKVGTITACFHPVLLAKEKPRRVAKKKSPPSDGIRRAAPEAGVRETGPATGFGARVPSDLAVLDLKFGALREVVSVRYSKRETGPAQDR